MMVNQVTESEKQHYFDCASMMRSVCTHYKLRLLLVTVFGAINFLVHVVPAFSANPIWGILALLYLIALFILAFKAKPDQLGVLIGLLFLLGLGAILGLCSMGLGVGLLFVYATQILEYKRLQWLKQQEGYPDFDLVEELREQGAFDYQAPYDVTTQDEANEEMIELDYRERDRNNMPTDAQMPVIEGLEALQAPPQRKPASRPKMPERPNTPVPEAFAGISPMMGTAPVQNTKPLPEPNVPKVDFDVPTDIPDPVWDIPDPVMDTSAVVSDFPEINGNIADLPDLPDIPQI